MKQSRVFLRFFVPYLVVLLVPIVFGAFGVLRILNALQTQYEQSEFAQFSHRTELLDQRLQELDATVTQLAFNSNVRALLDSRSPFEDGTIIPTLLDLQRDLSSISLTNRFVADLSLTFQRSQVVVTEYHIYFGLPVYYGSFFRYGALSQKQWTDLILGEPHQKEFLSVREVMLNTSQGNITTEPMLSLVQSLPIDAYGLRAAISAFVPEKEVLSELGWVDRATATQYGVFDKFGNMLLGTLDRSKFNPFAIRAVSGGAQKISTSIDGAGSFVFQVISQRNGWRYVEVLPSRLFARQMSSETLVTAALLILAIIVGALLSYWAAAFTSRPIANAIRMLLGREDEDSSHGRGALTFLVRSVSRLVEHDEEFHRILAEQEPLFRLAFLDRLLTGWFKTDEEIRTYLSQTALNEPNLPVKILLIRVRQGKGPSGGAVLRKANIAKAVVKSQIQRDFRRPTYTHDVDFENIAVLVERADWDVADRVHRTLERMIKRGEGIMIESGLGEHADSLVQISRSYAQACTAIRYRRREPDDPVVHFAEIPVGGTAVVSPGIGDRLVNAAVSGDPTDAFQLLDSFYQDNYIARRPSLETQLQLEYFLRDVLGKIAASLDKLNRAGTAGAGVMITEDFDEASTVSELLQTVRGAILAANNVAEGARKSHNVLLRDAVLKYLQEHFDDPGLYQQSVASHFRISREYLSQFFREQTGENFSVYLERLRIQKAKYLIQHEDVDLGVVANRCGYNSASALRRAFKRIEGIAPGAYRDLARNLTK